MDGITLDISLQNKNARTFGIVGIVIYDLGGSNTRQYVPQRNIIISQFVVAMARYENFSSADKALDSLKCLAHGQL